MAKKSVKKTGGGAKKAGVADIVPSKTKVPDETIKKLEAIKKKLDKFKDKVLERFEDYVLGMALLPPDAVLKSDAPKDDNLPKDAIRVLVLIDDQDSKKMSKSELYNKLLSIMKEIAGVIDKKIVPEVLLITELWESCYDGKTEILKPISMAAPVYDKGMLAAIKISEIHKSMVLKKFEKYIVSYVLAGSLVQGRATPESDIDVFIVIDDTDVKRMTRAELKDKLRAIIIGMGLDAGEMTGIKNKLNIQVYILTDFWDFIKEASPVIFTFLRDGVPLYDRGIFMPWKHLLKMGRVKPSQEAIDLYKSSGDQMISRMRLKMRDMLMEDAFYAVLTPTQAALMLYGIPPPTPKETPDVVRDIFVKKEKLLEESYAKILERAIKNRKDLEHGTKKSVSGSELQKVLDDAEKYLKRLQKLFEQIEDVKEKETIISLYESCVTISRDALKTAGVDKVSETDILKRFKSDIIDKGLVPERYYRLLKDIFKAKKEFESGKLSKSDIVKLRSDAREFIRFLVEHVQRVRARELDKIRFRVRYGANYGEITIFDNLVFIIVNVSSENKEVLKAKISPDGSLSDIQNSSLEEYDHSAASLKPPKDIFIKEKTFEGLKKIFGDDVSVLLNY